MIPNLHAPRYVRQGKCLRCGACCLGENCEHLLVGGKERTTCAIFGKPERPVRCLLFPANPPLVFKSCGYCFLDLWEDGKTVRGKL